MEPRDDSRARALIAIGALAALAALIAAVLVLGGSEDGAEAAGAPEECIELWNSDRQAVSNGIHNASAHGYTRVQIAYASEDGSEIRNEPVAGGGCIVIFAAQALDPEPVAAAEINLDGRWSPMSESAEPARLAELKSDALSEANAQLAPDGRVTAQ